MQVFQLEGNTPGSDGSGAQKKVWIDPQHLIKVDTKRREALKEVSAFKLGTAMGLNCAYYEDITVTSASRPHKACITASFLQPDEIEVTVSTIIDAMNVALAIGEPTVSVINKTIKAVADYTGIPCRTVAMWLYDMLVFDFLICNDDRHLTNFEVLFNPTLGTYRLAPYFDQGSSFLGADRELSLAEYERAVRRLKSKPFSTNPRTNLGDKALAKASMCRLLSNVGGKEDAVLSVFHNTLHDLQQLIAGNRVQSAGGLIQQE